jgi:hypothetical protein
MPRAYRSLIILAVLTTLAAGLLAGPAGVGSDIQVGARLLLLVPSAALLVRVLRHLTPR